MAQRRRSARVTVIDPIEENSAINAAVDADQEQVADQLSSVLDDLRGFISEESQVLIYKMPPRGGPWEYIKTLTPPLNSESILDELKDDWGGGQYMFRVRANGRIVTAKRATIAGLPKTPQEKAEQASSDMKDLLPLVLTTAQSSADKTLQMMTMMMQQQQLSSQQQMQMMMGMMTTLVPALMGGKQDPAQMVQAMAAVFAAMKPDKDGNGIAETLALLASAKELFAGNEGNPDESIFQTLLKTVGPGLAEAVAKNPQILAPPQQHQAPPRPQVSFRPNPTGPVSAPGMTAPMMRVASPGPQTLTVTAPGELTPAVYAADPVLSVIGEDVLYFARRNIAPEIAAEAVLQRLSDAQVTDDDIMALVLRFNASSDWITDLAGSGIDLTGRRAWANEFISSLVSQYSENNAEEDNTSREAGSEGDTEHDAGFSA